MKPTTSVGLFVSGAVFGAVLTTAGLALAQAQGVLPAPHGRQTNQMLGTIDLGQAFPSMAGYELSLRIATTAPGAGLTPHSHKDAPEIVHIISGHLSEQREGGPIVVHGPGDTVINDPSVRHSVLNQGAEPVVMYATVVGHPRKTPTANP